MGNCRSCEATAVLAGEAGSGTTAKVVLQDGEVREFERAVRVSHVLQLQKEEVFVCNADDMDFQGLVVALNAEEELQPGHLYFILPRSMLRRPLRPDEMAALAVRASAALIKCRCPVVFTDIPLPLPLPCRVVREVEQSQRQRHRRAGSRGRDFTSMLTAIPETSE